MSWRQSWLARLIPTYGNWGGPGWTGGTREYLNWDKSAVDSLDVLFYIHDLGYFKSKCEADKRRADIRLITNLEALPQNSRKWLKSPASPFYAELYRTTAIWVFQAVAWVRSFHKCRD